MDKANILVNTNITLVTLSIIKNMEEARRLKNLNQEMKIQILIPSLMKANLLMGSLKDKESNDFRMGICLLDNSKRAKGMAKESISMRMEMSTKVNGHIIFKMDMGY